MRMIHIQRDGQEFGVFSEDQILPMLQRGILRRTDQAWNPDLTKWDLLEIAVPLPPEDQWPAMVLISRSTEPSSDGTADTTTSPGEIPVLPYHAEAVDSGEGQPIPWKWALVTGCIGCALHVLMLALQWQGWFDRHKQNTPSLEIALIILLILVVGIFVIVAGSTCYYLHDRCCMALPSAHRKGSGSDSVFKLLIPFYNVYLVFPIYGQLARNYTQWALVS